MSNFFVRVLFFWVLGVETFLIVMAVVAAFDSRNTIAQGCAFGAVVFLVAAGIGLGMALDFGWIKLP